MLKYSSKIIEDYINGEEIFDYTLEELEDDPAFMLEVIKYCKDPKMYNLCSDNVKKDYKFVRRLIQMFKKDLLFITYIADEYLKQTEDVVSKLELAIVMKELTNMVEDNPYDKMCEFIYGTEIIRIAMQQSKLNSNDLTNQLGMGFILLCKTYNNSEVALNYLAKKVMDDIFDIVSLEDYLHKSFKKPENVNNQGIEDVLLNLISYYDLALASFLSSHIYLLESLKDEVKIILDKWDSYKLERKPDEE